MIDTTRATGGTGVARGPRRRHEIPTHLDVPDRAWLGLSVRQVLSLAVGATASYALWYQWTDLAAGPRLGLAGANFLAALGTVLVRPGGRGLAAWVFALARFAITPRVGVWRPDDARVTPLDGATGHADGWEAFAPGVRWPVATVATARSEHVRTEGVRP